MKLAPSPTMLESVKLKLRPYRFAVPLLISLVAAVVMLIYQVHLVNQQGRVLLRALSQHVAVLVETNDLIELQRFVSTTSMQSDSLIEVTRNDIIVASSYSRGSIGERHQNAESNSILPTMRDGFLMVSVAARRVNGPDVNAKISRLVAIDSVARTILATLTLTFLAGSVIVLVLTHQMAKAVTASLKPIEALSAAVGKLATLDEVSLDRFHIRELDVVSESINRAHQQLRAKTIELTEARGNELANESVKQLLHDLHTPITALRQMAKIASGDRHSPRLRDSARSDIVELAEQLVGQISAGKQNLGMKVVLQSERSLNETIERAGARLKAALMEKEIDFMQSQPREEIRFPHDPIMLERAVSNMVMNAAEANATRIELLLDVVGGEPRIRISDNGPGMNPQEVALHLKGRGRSSKSDRNGIGLSNSSLIAKSHGTKLVYRRSRFGGSEFEMRFTIENDAGVV